MSEPIVQFSHGRIGQRWTLCDHAKLLEYVHQVNRASLLARKLPNGAQAEALAKSEGVSWTRGPQQYRRDLF